MALKIFISHAKEDHQQAQGLYDFLKGAGHSPWMDEFDLIPGQQWRDAIRQEIEATDVFMICLSTTLVRKKGFVQAELKFALEQALLLPADQIYIIPLKLDNCQLPYSLQGLHAINYFGVDGITHLLRSLKKIQGDLQDHAAIPDIQSILGLYRILFEKESLQDIKRKLHYELQANPQAAVYNLLYCIASLKNNDLTLDNVRPDTIEALQQRLQWAMGEQCLISTATYVLALITHDYYETRFRSARPSSKKLLGRLRQMDNKPEKYLIEQLKHSRSFLFKVKISLP